ncbi:hypothetical protein BH23PAT1_BH23PAT1_2800 [soil metagenome]
MGNNSPDILPSVQNPSSPGLGEGGIAPEGEGPDRVDYNEQAVSKALEQGGAAPASGQPFTPQGQSATPVPPLQDPSSIAQPLQLPDDNSHPAVADDTDLIEKEWVVKAKEIVARTSQDPHKQNQELTNMKVGYLKKRYNKDIKLSKES